MIVEIIYDINIPYCLISPTQSSFSMEARRKFNLHKTFIKRAGRFPKLLLRFNLGPVFRGQFVIFVSYFFPRNNTKN